MTSQTMHHTSLRSMNDVVQPKQLMFTAEAGRIGMGLKGLVGNVSSAKAMQAKGMKVVVLAWLSVSLVRPAEATMACSA